MKNLKDIKKEFAKNNYSLHKKGKFIIEEKSLSSYKNEIIFNHKSFEIDNFYNIFLLNNIQNLIIFLIIIINIQLSYSKVINNRKLLLNSELIMKINEKSYKKILNCNTNPSKVVINGEENEINSNYFYDLREDVNFIKIIWENKINSCNSMFKNIENIIDIDFTKFDTSEVTDMGDMFYGCISLISLDLSNFITSQVVTMNTMFQGCSKLEYLNINNFDLSSVTTMSSMFHSCNELISLDLSNLNAPKLITMNNLFDGCNKLTFLDLNNFQVSSYTSLDFMFCNCNFLTSLDLNNFDKNKISDILSKLSSNNIYPKICINETNLSGEIQSLLTSFIIDCEEICSHKVKKYTIHGTSKCIDNCYNDNTYKYTYNNECYESCPEGKEGSFINNYFCEDINSDSAEKSYTNELTLIIDNQSTKTENSNNKTDIKDIIDNQSTKNENSNNYNDIADILDNQSTKTENSNNNNISNYLNNIDNYIFNNNTNNYKNYLKKYIDNEIINNNIDIIIFNLTNGNKEDFIVKENDIIYQNII